MMPRIRRSLATSSGMAFAFVGCNAILDNQPGSLIAVEAGAMDDSGAVPAMTLHDASDSDTTAAFDAADASSPVCATGRQRCFGTCVSLIDPLYGCGDPTCSPCPSAHSMMGCAGRKCVVIGCDPSFSDCNQTSADGCETDLSKATSCGACNAVCGVVSPVCTPVGSSFECTDGCTPAAPLRCGAVCVDPNTSTSQCGGCDVKCPVVANGTEACVAGVCSFTCSAGFDDCDANAANGCETNLASDPAHCGSCGTACVAPATCVASVCK